MTPECGALPAWDGSVSQWVGKGQRWWCWEEGGQDNWVLGYLVNWRPFLRVPARGMCKDHKYLGWRVALIPWPGSSALPHSGDCAGQGWHDSFCLGLMLLKLIFFTSMLFSVSSQGCKMVTWDAFFPWRLGRTYWVEALTLQMLNAYLKDRRWYRQRPRACGRTISLFRCRALLERCGLFV